MALSPGDQGKKTYGGDGVVLHEEVLDTDTEDREISRLGIKKLVQSFHESKKLERQSESAQTERRPATEGDSGEVEYLEDGSISVPVFEEQLVVTRRLIVRERIIVRKQTHEVTETIEADLKREHAQVEREQG